MFILAPIHKLLFFYFHYALPIQPIPTSGPIPVHLFIGTFKVHAQNALLEEHFDLPAGATIRDHGWYAHSASTLS